MNWKTYDSGFWAGRASGIRSLGLWGSGIRIGVWALGLWASSGAQSAPTSQFHGDGPCNLCHLSMYLLSGSNGTQARCRVGSVHRLLFSIGWHLQYAVDRHTLGQLAYPLLRIWISP